MNERQVASTTENRILAVSSCPVFIAGGKLANEIMTNMDTDVSAANHLAYVSIRVGGCSAVACAR